MMSLVSTISCPRAMLFPTAQRTVSAVWRAPAIVLIPPAGSRIPDAGATLKRGLLLGAKNARYSLYTFRGF